MTKIKICGLSQSQDILAVNKAKPDYVGFVFAESRRQVTPAQARALKSILDPHILAVGVFVDAKPHEIIRLCRDGVIDLIQLHGHEDAAYIKALKKAVPNLIIKAVRVQDPQQVLDAQKLPCDYLLLDSADPSAAGGTGKTFDHRLIPPLEKPFFLAGGLHAGNIKAAAGCRPYGLDVSSGAETNGSKDPAKIEEIVKIVRSEI